VSGTARWRRSIGRHKPGMPQTSQWRTACWRVSMDLQLGQNFNRRAFIGTAVGGADWRPPVVPKPIGCPSQASSENLATRLNLSEPELREAEEQSSTTARVVYEAVRREGEDELKRSSPALACSGLAAGLSMGFSLGRIRHCHSGTPAIVHGEYADPDSSAFAQPRCRHCRKCGTAEGVVLLSKAALLRGIFAGRLLHSWCGCCHSRSTPVSS
jgi:hypothetical protein